MYQQIAKLIQDLLQGASISASRQNSANLSAVHGFLDGIQQGRLVVTPTDPVQDSVKPKAEKK